MTQQGPLRVLIAEDDHLVGEMVKGYLEEAGYAVVGEAADGLEAVSLAKSLRPDVVLMDIEMPDMDGIEATRQIFTSCPTPVVALTAYDTPELVELAGEAGVGAYIIKPASRRELERAITIATARFDDMMALRRLSDELQKEIVECKRVEGALRESEGRYRLLAEHAADVIWVRDMNLMLKYISPSVSKLRGFSVDEVMKQSIDENMTPASAEIARKILAEEIALEKKEQKDLSRTRTFEMEMKCKDGSTVWVEFNVRFLRDQHNRPTGMLGITRDISERKKAEESLQELNAELERSNRDLEDFTYMVSHDLQEPLRKMHTFGKFLLEDCGDALSDAGKEHIQRIQNASVRMKGFIQHLLELSRVGTRGGTLVALQPQKIIERALETLSHRIRESGGRVTMDAAMPVVKADPVQLERVFQNLIGNALKYRAPDRAPSVTITSRVENAETVFIVTDNGIGIEERSLEKIFLPFQRMHPDEEIEGAGIGLALCAKIVRRHGGRIRAESEVGRGSIFRFTLPNPRETEENAQ